jgi:hypothetical protein
MALAKIASPMVALALTIAAAPAAFASDNQLAMSDSSAEMIKMADEMARPDNIRKMSGLVEGITEAMMQIPVGQMAAAVEKASPGAIKNAIPANATLSDLAGQDADRLPKEFAAKTRGMMSMAGSFARIFAEMLPQFERMGKEMEARIRTPK